MNNVTTKKINEYLLDALEDVEEQFSNYSKRQGDDSALMYMDMQKVRAALSIAREWKRQEKA